MKGRLILAASSAVVLGLFVGISFSVQMTPEVILVVTIIRHIRISLPIKIPSLTLSEHCMALQVKAVQYGTFLGSNGDADANSTSRGKGSNMLDRFWGTLRTADVSSSSSSSLQMC